MCFLLDKVLQILELVAWCIIPGSAYRSSLPLALASVPVSVSACNLI